MNKTLFRNMHDKANISFGKKVQSNQEIIIESLDPLRAKKTSIRKKLGHTMVSAIKASSVTL